MRCTGVLFRTVSLFENLGFFFVQQHLFEVFVLLVEQKESGKATLYVYLSRGQISRSQPSIRCFTLA